CWSRVYDRASIGSVSRHGPPNGRRKKMWATYASPKSPSTERAKDDGIAVSELRADMLHSLTLWTMFSGLVAFVLLSNTVDLKTWLPAFFITATGYAAFRLVRIATLVASILLVGALWLIVTGCVVLFPSIPFATL